MEKTLSMKVLITGATGFFGKHVTKALQPHFQLFCVGRRDFDLLDPARADAMFLEIQPNIVVHLAAKVGGILANKSYPAEFFYKNMLITANIWELSKKYAIDKLIYVMPGCAYPKNAKSPIKESSLWDGYPDEFPAPGALAKKMGVAAAYAYRQQYGLKSSIIIPANMYGEFDNFNEYDSHVIPALISKMHKAKKNNVKKLTLWGSGNAVRDFVYAEDVAKCIPHFISNSIEFECENSSLKSVCNISSGTGYSIRELANLIGDIVGFSGEIAWDLSKPEGPSNKVFDNSNMKKLKLDCTTCLQDGIRRTYEWYCKNY
jgi:GDP-L-fucose synthase